MNAVDNEVVLDQNKVFVGVEFVQLFDKSGVLQKVLLRLREAGKGKGFQNGESALHLSELVTGQIIANAVIVVRPVPLLVGIHGWSNERFKGKAVVDLLGCIRFGIAHFLEDFFHKPTAGVALDSSVVGRLFILRGIVH